MGWSMIRRTILSSKFYETAKYYALTQHIFLAARRLFSEATFKRMDPKLRDGFLDAAKKAAADTRTHGLAVEKEALQILVEKGVTVIDCDRELFRKRVLPQTENFVKARPDAQADRRHDPRHAGLRSGGARASGPHHERARGSRSESPHEPRGPRCLD